MSDIKFSYYYYDYYYLDSETLECFEEGGRLVQGSQVGAGVVGVAPRERDDLRGVGRGQALAAERFPQPLAVLRPRALGEDTRPPAARDHVVAERPRHLLVEVKAGDLLQSAKVKQRSERKPLASLSCAIVGSQNN